jgi:hypothetical protein
LNLIQFESTEMHVGIDLIPLIVLTISYTEEANAGDTAAALMTAGAGPQDVALEGRPVGAWEEQEMSILVLGARHQHQARRFLLLLPVFVDPLGILVLWIMSGKSQWKELCLLHVYIYI